MNEAEALKLKVLEFYTAMVTFYFHRYFHTYGPSPYSAILLLTYHIALNWHLACQNFE